MVLRPRRRPFRQARRGSRAPVALVFTRQPRQQRFADIHRVVSDERELSRAMRY